MNKVLRTSPPGWFWLVSIFLLAWNGLWAFVYLSSVMASPEQLAGRYDEAEAAVMAATPFWVTGAFAVAAFAGLIGAVGLLAKRGWARGMFIASLVAWLIDHVWMIFISDWLTVAGAQGIIVPLVVDILAIFGIWFAARGIRRGWLR